MFLFFWMAAAPAAAAAGAGGLLLLREPPHVVNGTYDRRWVAERILAPPVVDANGWEAVLVALVDKGSCAYDPITLRHAQRFRPKRFMRTAVAFKEDWEEWPIPKCGLALYDKSGARTANLPSLDASASARARVTDFVHSTARAEKYTFQNRLDTPLTVSWFDVTREEGISGEPWREVAIVPARSSTTISSVVSHVFGVSTTSNGEFVAKFVCRGDGDVAVVDRDALNTATSTCENPSDHNAADMYETEVAKLETRDQIVRFAAREQVYDIAMEKRLALSDVQTNLVPNVTDDGFRLVQMPAKTYSKVLGWYRENHDRLKVPESDGGPLYNQRAVPTWHTPLPPRLKDQVFDELKLTMEAWAPATAPLHGTSAYGVRTYENGSYLHLHVDTASTHVVSGIINVDQQSRVPWPVQIFDHQGNLHQVEMHPGNMLLYESAKLLHGRVVPFDGKFYANIFVHYAPETWPVSI
ncbi:hypothetical protein CTAYLR_003132 [Chrysophaeum taylorii]|uniref:Prolyl 4-hydroxylase alpha subunit domain-containing protein n=1 Tax=Chrysophaeum taylorii TaxID=2483200 RepID=A0AAD7UQP4_9STRA|nr:hypothetical protein CTAYLR_003132 [Chrysophaeum taylorii]